ncbi:MAG: NAD(P)H-quinone oxidoreductase [Methylovulum sp.]|uniref:NAD(P)H-quinone oxidoreductase n=1 Tax=Methylovulum sp. TaxID=1916980 RepID=UPI0026150088|nr:NAD(P)H-quinone oxidoreductase [Methylovulum sp.]MDD2723034.1 NAD(P)H-quinone oxidoreductase [Methylovulum sp.]MDD5124776.1 NAD(P)H-quinone oxidoreductase [Methylovulum sp.]
MRVIEIQNHALLSSERAIPEPASYQVLVKVAAAGINRPDVMQRNGLYPPPPGASDIPGLEIAGTVAAVGDAVTPWRVGDTVCALVTGGGYAEYCLASAALCLPVPESLSLLEAAALPETFFTVWSNIFDRAGLNANETLLVHGGGSGIGTTAIQLARAFGAKVFISAGSEEKCHFCRELGAEAAINYREQDFVEAVLQLTQHRGVDVILDMIGGDYLPRNIKCLATDGRLVQIAVQQGAKSELNLWAVMQKRLTLTGSTLRGRDDAFKAAIAQKLYKNVWPLLESGTIKPVIHRIFPLNDAALAHALMESNQHIGKIILQVSP